MAAQQIGTNEAIEQLSFSLQRWLVFEREHLHKPAEFQNLALDPNFPTNYLPQHCDVFALPCYWVRRKYLLRYGSTNDERELRLFHARTPDDCVLFPVHPTCLDQYRKFLDEVGAIDAAKEGLRIWAVPTSSTRTVLAWPDELPHEAVFLKLSLFSPLFGDRRLSARVVGRSVGMCQIARSSPHLPIDYLPEPIGFVPRSLDSGFIVRQIPAAIKEGRMLVAPFFALMGGERPLLLTLLDRSDLTTHEFNDQLVCARFARVWFELAFHHGLFAESHGQDLLLPLTPDLTPMSGLLCRDCEGLQADWELRNRLHPPTLIKMPHAHTWRETYDTWGYGYGAMVWNKMYTTLFAYLHFVLRELENSLQEWHKKGLLPGPAPRRGELTSAFSYYLMDAVEKAFNVPVGGRFDLSDRKSMFRFLRVLMGVRRDILATPSPAATG